MEPKFCWIVVALLFERTTSQDTNGDLTQPQIISYDSQNYGQDGYKLAYTIDDGTVRQEEGFYETGVWMVFWKSEWKDPEGKTVLIEYTPTGVSWSIRSPIEQPPVVSYPVEPTYPDFYRPTRPPPLSGVPFGGPVGFIPSKVPIYNRFEPTKNKTYMFVVDGKCYGTAGNALNCASLKSLGNLPASDGRVYKTG